MMGHGLSAQACGWPSREDRRMLRDDTRYAAARRDDGIRKISRITRRAGAAGIACSAFIALAFGHHGAARAAQPGHSGDGTIVIPAQPPALARGSGQVSSGAS